MVKRLWAYFLGIAAVANLATTWIPRLVKLEISIPESVFLGLIVTLFLFFGLLIWDIDRHGMKEPQKIKWPKLEPSKEILYVMALLTGESQRRMKMVDLEGWYSIAFKKNPPDFNELVNNLQARDYFDTRSIYPEHYCEITSEGISYYEKYANEKRWRRIIDELKREKASQPPTVFLESRIG